MDKTKVSLVIAPIIVSVVCIVLAVNAVVLNAQLNKEKAKVDTLNAQIIELGSSFSDVNVRYNEQVRLVKDLQYSLEAAKRGAEEAKTEVNNLKVINADLGSRLNAALDALQSSAGAEKAIAIENPAE